ncbi:MAG TPA: heparinase II/III family protein [Gemmatimonadales bacterium]|nr:heparinase II/III family protein [Gemmatimonadales bacterium]
MGGRSHVVTAESLAGRREVIAASPDLSALLARQLERARPVLDQAPPIPTAKALLSMDGGVCPKDASHLQFDPWSPTAHTCPRCRAMQRGERHDRWWARFQHLWLAERAAHLAAVAALAGDRSAAAGASRLLTYYGEHYFEYLNRDNVLGPSRLFFSTYLESIWLTNYLAAAVLLRESDQLDPATANAVAGLGEEAANLIGEFDEGLSNRQTWHNAALAALAVWFEDEELLRRSVEGPSGLVAHLIQGFGADGMWSEGENYHLFALRGLLIGLDWVRSVGVDPLEESQLARRLESALRAPALTALPDRTFPARKDSRFGVSLAQPMYLELWERGGELARGTDGEEHQGIADWLAGLYAVPAPPAELFDSYLHEAGESAPARRGRADLSWWMLLGMAPSFDGDASRWQPGSTLFQSQGLAVLRAGGRYASVEGGTYGGGHGHPDRLNLTLHERGVYWLPDFGTGSYVSRDLFWYRSTLAHNAPQLDAMSQRAGDAVCEYFEAKGSWAWVRARFGGITRSVVSGPRYLLDVVEFSGDMEHRLELPWHLTGRLDVRAPGPWKQAASPGPFTKGAEHCVVGSEQLTAAATVDGGGQTMVLSSRGAAELVRATAPGAPGTGDAPFLLFQGEGRASRFVSVLAPTPAEIRVEGEAIAVSIAGETDRHHSVVDGWEIATATGEIVRLGGRRPESRIFEPLINREPPLRQTGTALRPDAPPALDATLDGFDTSAPLALDHEDQYRRSEEPYSGPEDFSALAYANWDDEALYLAVEVTKPDIALRAADVPPLLLDNEPDDIHSDGLQVYVRLEPDAEVYGFLIVPEPDGQLLRVQVPAGYAGNPAMISGAWAPGDVGYSVTLALRLPGWESRTYGDRIGFDLLVNEMLPDRERRSGQLVWSGGSGWVWLRGDRQAPDRFGELELA